MKKMFSVARTLCMMSLGAVALTACHETDYYDPNFKMKEYTFNWESRFGSVDPEQDWNMATLLTANVALPNVKGICEVRLYSANPFEVEKANLLAQKRLESGTEQIQFDAPKNTSEVFVTVRSGLYFIETATYPVVNGMVNIDGQPQQQAQQRPARISQTCNVTIGEQIKLLNNTYTPTIINDATPFYIWSTDNTFKEVDGVIYALINGTWVKGELDNEGWWCFNGQRNNALQYSGAWNNQTKELNKTNLSRIAFHPAFYRLNNNTSTPAETTWKCGEGFGLFSTGKFYAEQEAYFSDKKMALEGYDINKVEQGISIITTAATPLTLTMVYGATNKNNILGYYYYRDGQNKMEVPRFLLIEDARPTSNIFMDAGHTTPIGGNNWLPQQINQLSYMDENSQQFADAANTAYYGTVYKVVYFGDNYDEAGTYTLPKDVHVEFFIMNIDNINQPTYSCDGPHFSYGDPAANYEIGKFYGSEANNAVYDTNRGAVKATMWKYNGRQYIGFEDGGYDEDLNDLVFLINGFADNHEEHIDVPSTDLPTEATSWIVACEDLGSADDYDFNDVVFSVSHVAGQTTATVTPLAAGGVLPSYLWHDGVSFGEIHQLIDPNATEPFKMINTFYRGTPGQPITINVDEDFTMSNEMGKFSIYVKGEQSITIGAPTKGSVPQMICVPSEWVWPLERVSIEKAYPLFGSWSQSAGTNTSWYTEFVQENLVK